MRDLGGPVAVVLDTPGDQLQLVVTGSDRGGPPLAALSLRGIAGRGGVEGFIEAFTGSNRFGGGQHDREFWLQGPSDRTTGSTFLEAPWHDDPR